MGTNGRSCGKLFPGVVAGKRVAEGVSLDKTERKQRRMEELISVIVPVYQVKAFLPECVESLLGQTYKNLEIILVDDGSTDGSEKLCDEYAKKDGRVKVVHQAHFGVSNARNRGLQMATGEYVAFVDSDDIASEFFLETLYTLLKSYRADVAVCAYERRKEGEVKQRSKKTITYSISSEEMLQEWHGIRKGLETVLWNKLYRRELFGVGDARVLFPEGKEHEDTCISHLLIQKANTIAITNQILYMYRIRKGSITESSVTVEKIRQDIEAQLSRIAFFEEKGFEESRDRVIVGFLLHVVMYEWKLRERIGEENQRKKGSVGELKKELCDFFQKYYTQINKSSELKSKEKIILKLAAVKYRNRRGFSTNH